MMEGHLGMWGGDGEDAPAALGRNLLPLPPYLQPLHSVGWGDDRESSVSHVLSA